MTVLVLIGPVATEPVELGRRVASGLEFTALVGIGCRDASRSTVRSLSLL